MTDVNHRTVQPKRPNRVKKDASVPFRYKRKFLSISLSVSAVMFRDGLLVDI